VARNVTGSAQGHEILGKKYVGSCLLRYSIELCTVRGLRPTVTVLYTKQQFGPWVLQH
jgi:hypothetical protein